MQFFRAHQGVRFALLRTSARSFQILPMRFKAKLGNNKPRHTKTATNIHTYENGGNVLDEPAITIAMPTPQRNSPVKKDAIAMVTAIANRSLIVMGLGFIFLHLTFRMSGRATARSGGCVSRRELHAVVRALTANQSSVPTK